MLDSEQQLSVNRTQIPSVTSDDMPANVSLRTTTWSGVMNANGRAVSHLSNMNAAVQQLHGQVVCCPLTRVGRRRERGVKI